MAFDISRKITFALGLTGDDKVKAGMKGVTDSMGATDKAVAAAKLAFTGLLGVVSVAAFSAWVKTGIEAADAAYQISQKTGLATKDVAGLQLAFKLGIGSADGMSTAMAKMAKQAVEGNSAFKTLGVSTRNADGSMRGMKDILYDTADAFADVKDGTAKSVLAMEIFGKTGADLIPLLNGGADGLREMADMAEKLGLVIEQDVAAQADKFNDTLDLLKMGGQGVATQLAAQLLPAFNAVAGGMLNWLTEGGKVKSMADALGAGMKILYTIIAGGIEVISTIGQGFGALGAAIAAVFSGDFAGAKAVMNDFMDTAKKDWASAIANIGAVWDGTSAKTAEAGGQIVKAQRDITLSTKDTETATKAAAAAKDKEAEAYLAFKGKIADLILAQQQELEQGEKLTAADKLLLDAKQKLSGAELATAEAMVAVAKQQEQALDLRKRETAAMAEAVKARNDGLKALDSEAVKLQEQIDAQNNANFTLATGVDRTRELEVARLRDSAASAERSALIALERNEDEAQYEAFKKNAAKLRELADSKERGIGLEAARKAADEWTKVTDQISQGLTDSLYRAFEAGGGFFSTLWEGIKNTFKTTVLRLVVDTVMRPVNAVLGSVLGTVGTAAQAGTGLLGGLGDMGSLFGGLGGVLSPGGGIGGGVLGGLGTIGGSISNGLMGFATSGVGQALGLSSTAVDALGYAYAAPTAAGSAMAALGPIALGLAAVVALAKKLDSSGTPHFGGYYATNPDGSLNAAYGQGESNRRSDYDKIVGGIVQPVHDTLSGLARAFGLSTSIVAAGDLKVEDAGKDGAWGVARIGVGSTMLTNRSDGSLGAKLEDAVAGYSELFAGTMRQALDLLDLPAWASEALGALGDSPGLEAVTQAVQGIIATKTALVGLTDSLTPLGGMFSTLAGLSDEAKLSLAGMVGGLDALVAKSQGFVDAYYSDEEKLGISARKLLSDVQRAGVDPLLYSQISQLKTKDDFRAFAEGLPLGQGGDDGLRLAALALNLAAPFAAIAQQLETLDVSLSEAATLGADPAVLAMLNSANEAAAVAAADAATAALTTAAAATDTASNTAATAESVAESAALLREVVDGIKADTVANSEGLATVIATLTELGEQVARIETQIDLASLAP
jgi:hypothetical protein